MWGNLILVRFPKEGRWDKVDSGIHLLTHCSPINLLISSTNVYLSLATLTGPAVHPGYTEISKVDRLPFLGAGTEEPDIR